MMHLSWNRLVPPKLKYVIVVCIVLYIINITFSATKLTSHKDSNLDLDDVLRESNKKFEILETFEKINNVISSKVIDATKKHQKISKLYGRDLKWIELLPSFYVLEAYLDKRKAEYFIRILLIMDKKYDLSCIVPQNSKILSIKADAYEFNENHGAAHGGYIYSCRLPYRMNLNEFQLLINFRNIRKKLVLHHLQPSSSIWNFTICIPPIFGNLNIYNLVEFIEMNRVLGANHFFFYIIDSVKPEVINILQNYYEKAGIATVFKWYLPVDNSVWYHGQMSAIHHCLYQNIGRSKYTVFQDLDELLVPMRHNNWSMMMDQVDRNGNHCGYQISSIFVPRESEYHFYLSSQRRSKNINTVRTKCIVRPDFIFEQGIHHISKQNVESMTPSRANTLDALIFHYRDCDNAFGFNCENEEPVKRVLKWKKDYLANYNISLKNIRLIISENFGKDLL